jgi:hypothetical protein
VAGGESRDGLSHEQFSTLRHALYGLRLRPSTRPKSGLAQDHAQADEVIIGLGDGLLLLHLNLLQLLEVLPYQLLIILRVAMLE